MGWGFCLNWDYVIFMIVMISPVTLGDRAKTGLPDRQRGAFDKLRMRVGAAQDGTRDARAARK